MLITRISPCKTYLYNKLVITINLYFSHTRYRRITNAHVDCHQSKCFIIIIYIVSIGPFTSGKFEINYVTSLKSWKVSIETLIWPYQKMTSQYNAQTKTLSAKNLYLKAQANYYFLPKNVCLFTSRYFYAKRIQHRLIEWCFQCPVDVKSTQN